MNLYALMQQRAADGRPVRVGIIGAGKFASMYLAQTRRIPGVHIAAVADLEARRARDRLAAIGWPAEAYDAPSLDAAIKAGTTWITEDAEALIAAGSIEVVVEATGDPAAGIRHALLAARHGKHIVMVTVEADAVAGPLLAREVERAGRVYSLAYGDQPALICELVDWARASGFRVVAAGRGHKWLPDYRKQAPDDTIWAAYGLTPEQARAGGMNPRMYTSFLDGTKPAIETTAVANATGLDAPRDGIAFQPCSIDDLPQVMKPRAEGGTLDARGQVAVASSLTRDGQPVPHDIRWGVWVVYEAGDDYVHRCFSEVGLVTDDTGRYACSYKRWHVVGLELGISVANVAVRGEPTGAPRGFRADAVAMAKRPLKAGEALDGEGGYTVSGRLMPAADSVAMGALPIGLAHGVTLKADIADGAVVRWSDVATDETSQAVRVRREMEAAFMPGARRAAE